MSRPLEGVRVLDFTQFFAGPYCTLMLEDMGAEVIKLENPPAGDASRASANVENGASTNYSTKNRGKKTVLMNLKDEKQKALFLKMVKDADVVVENYKPGTMEKFGITYDLLKSINPRIVYTSISGFGQDGPFRDHTALDGVIQAIGGVMSITGEVGGSPLRCGVAIGDAAGGLFGAIATVGALYGVKATGEGRRIDISMLDAMVSMEENLISRYCQSGVIPKPLGNDLQTAVPFGTFVCKDQQTVYICVATDKQWKSFCEMLGREEWSQDPRFETKVLRVKHRADLNTLVQTELQEKWTMKELCDAMLVRKLPYGEINNFEQVVNHPQVQHRNMLVNVTYPNGAAFKVPGNPLKMSGQEDIKEYQAYPIGYHTMEVLADYASEEELHEIYDQPLQEAGDYYKKLYSKT